MNKTIYKLFTNTFRYLPLLLSIMILLSILLACLNITPVIVQLLSGSSLITLIFYYLASYLFHFCKIHRLGIHCLSSMWLLESLDSIFKFPITNGFYLLIVLLIYIIFIIYYIKLKYYEGL